MNLSTRLDNQVQKAKVQTKNKAQNINNKNSFIIYVSTQFQINDHLIIKLINQNTKAPKKIESQNLVIENFFHFNIKYKMGIKLHIKPAITTHQFFHDLNIS